MSNQPEPTKPWKPKDFAFYGAMLGFGLGIVHAYVHAFWSQISDSLPVEHIFWETVLFVVAGAALSAVLAVARNRLMRDRSFPTPNMECAGSAFERSTVG